MNCPIRFGWATPNMTLVLDCELDFGHAALEHTAMWHHGLNDDMPSTRISWLTDDRRSFAGPWQQCTGVEAQHSMAGAPCVLPAGHPGNHAP